MPGETQAPPAQAAPDKPGFATPEEALASLGPLRARIAKATDKTPASVLHAFEPPPAALAGFDLPPLNMRRWLLLEKIDSPFLRANAAGESEVTMGDLVRTFFVIALPIDEVAAAVRAGGDTFQARLDEFAELIPLSALPTLAQVIGEHIAREFEPKALMVSKEEGSGTGPKAKALSETAPEAS